MKVSVVKKEDLKHEYNVTVPADEVNARVLERLVAISKTAKIPGFRPGKIPMDILKKKYGQRVMGEVLEVTVDSTSRRAMADHKVTPAMQPTIKINKFEDGQDLEYNMTVEIMPAIELIDFSKLKLEKPVADVTDAEINDALDRFAGQFKDSKPLKTKRAVKKGDIVIIDFVGRVDGEEFPGGSGTDTRIIPGSNTFLPDFEAGVIGMKPDETKDVEVNFPENYGSKDLQGKTAIFTITVKEIHEEVMPKIDDALAQKAGLDTLDALRKAVEEHIAGEFSMAARGKLKRLLLDDLDKKYSFKVPQGLLTQEYDSIVTQYRKSQGMPAEQSAEQNNKDNLDKDTQKEFEQIADRRVKLGLLLAEVGQKNNITVNDDELRQAILREAQNYPGQEQKILEFYQKNPQAAAGLSAPILEEKVVDYIIELAQITEKTVSVDELFDIKEHDCDDESCDHPTHKKSSKKTKKSPAKKKPASKKTGAQKTGAQKKAPAKQKPEKA